MLVDLDELLTPAEAAAVIGVTPRRVRQLCAAGEIRHVWTPLGARLISRAVARDYALGRVGR